MSTDFHTALGFGGPMTAAYFNSRLSDLDAAIGGGGRRRGLRATTIDTATSASPLVVGHRGYARSAPENTIDALRAVVAAGYKAVEIDVQFSAEGEPILLHDSGLTRTTDFTSAPYLYSLMELRRMDAGSWYHADFSDQKIPTLREVFDALGGSVVYFIEMKGGLPGSPSNHATGANKVADVIAEYGLESHCVLGSFDDISAAAGGDAWSVHGIPLLRYSASPTADGTIGGATPAAHYAGGYRYVGLGIASTELTAATAAWQAVGAKVLAWTVNTRYDRDAALAAGVDGLMADDPLYIDTTKEYTLPVGDNIPFNAATVPAGVIPIYYTGTARAFEDPDSAGVDLKVGEATGIGYPLYGGGTILHSLLLGPLGWGANGIGKLTASMTVGAAPADTTRWGGLGIYTDDRGHVTGAGSDTSTGYFAILRYNGDLLVYRVGADGSETAIGSDLTGASLAASTSYTITLEVSSTQVIATGNGVTVTVNDATYRAMTIPALVRNRLACTFDAVERVS